MCVDVCERIEKEGRGDEPSSPGSRLPSPIPYPSSLPLDADHLPTLDARRRTDKPPVGSLPLRGCRLAPAVSEREYVVEELVAFVSVRGSVVNAAANGAHRR